METPVKSTPMPMIAGILCIVDGGLKLLALLGLFVASLVIPISQGSGFAVNASILLLAITIPLAIIGILAIVGGIYALQRRRFGLAVTGSIAAFLPFSLLGLASIILVALSKDEFE
jgi:hypothetical protein